MKRVQREKLSGRWNEAGDYRSRSRDEGEEKVRRESWTPSPFMNPPTGAAVANMQVPVSKLINNSDDVLGHLVRLVEELQMRYWSKKVQGRCHCVLEKFNCLTFWTRNAEIICCTSRTCDAVSCIVDSIPNELIQTGARAGRYETPESSFSSFLSTLVNCRTDAVYREICGEFATNRMEGL